MKTLEKWKPIEKYQGFKFDGKYEVSSWGNIRNRETGKPLATYSNQSGQGYIKTKITDTDGKRRALYLHRLVAYSFLEKPEENTECLEVNHKDGNPHNNSITNLEWITHIENVRHYRKGVKSA